MQLVVSSLAPMKLKNVKTPRSRKGGYAVAVTFALCLLFCFSLARVGAQRAQKRITSIWTATGAAGSRVTVASDVQLSDYEAYTRGDRFYVKIPFADLPSTTGSLLGRGFDDVQIQRAGDGILLSFRLQPGTAARVEPKLNRIEVVFSVPVRSQNSSQAVELNEMANRTRARTIRDTVGPTPPGSPRENKLVPGSSGRHAERGARTTGRTSRNSSAAAREPHRAASKTAASESTRQKSLKGKAVASSTPGASPVVPEKPLRPNASPSPQTSSENKGATKKGPEPTPNVSPASAATLSPSPAASPSSSPAGALSSATPAYSAPVAAQSPTTAGATPVSTSAGKSDWSARLHYYKEYVRLNPIPFAVFGLLFVLLLLLLFVRGGRKHRDGDRADRKKETVTPVPATADNTTVKGDPKPLTTTPASAPPSQSRVQARDDSRISPAAPDSAGQDPDREVFEL